MRKLLLIILAVCIPFLAVASERGNETSGEGEALARFAESGDLIPASARELLPEGFFSQNLIRAVADGRNFSSVIDIGESLRAGQADAEAQRLFLRLGNPGEVPNDIVLSVPEVNGAGVRNFLLRVEAESYRTINVSDLESAGSVYLLSLQAFSARLDIESPKGHRQIEVEVLAPAVLDGSGAQGSTANSTANSTVGSTSAASGNLCRNQSSYCSDCEENIQLCSGGSCSIARAVRTFWYSGSNQDYYKVNVHYPVSGPIFHCHWSTFSSAGTKKSCQAVGYTTFRPATAGVCTIAGSTMTHSWSFLDDTLFFGTPSSVSCSTGCSQSWTVTRF